MKRLEGIFQERQRLNLEAVSVMLPQVRINPKAQTLCILVLLCCFL